MKKDAVQIITAGDMSQATVTSTGIDINQMMGYSIQAVWTGSPVGNFTIEVSNDIVAVASSTSTENPVGPNPAANVVNWTTYTGSTVAAGGSTGNWTWVAPIAPYRWVRLKYTKSSSTGTVNATFFAKG